MTDYNPEQLRPMKTPQSNLVMKGPKGTEVGDLDVELAEDTTHKSIVTVSAWELLDVHRDMIAAGGHIRLSVWQHPIPPLAVAVEAPFCDADGAEMEFDQEHMTFKCPNCTAATNGSPPKEEPGEDDRDASRRALDQAHSDFEEEASPED